MNIKDHILFKLDSLLISIPELVYQFGLILKVYTLNHSCLLIDYADSRTDLVQKKKFLAK